MDRDGDGISGDVSSPSTDDEATAVSPIAADDPAEAPPHPNTSTPPATTGPTERESAFLRQMAPLFERTTMLSRLVPPPVPPLGRGPNTGRHDGVPPPPAVMGPTEIQADFLRLFARRRRRRRRYEHVAVSQVSLDGGGPTTNTGGRTTIPVLQMQFATRDNGGDVDVVDDDDAGAEEEDDDDDDDDDVFGFGFGAVVPASGVAIACLPETTVGDGEGRERIMGECAVCLEAYEAGDVVRTMPCAHGFHERCIFKWLSASRVCPLCRFAMPPEEDTDDEEEEEHEGDRRLEYLRVMFQLDDDGHEHAI